MENRRMKYASLGVSVCAHVIFLSLSTQLAVPGVRYILDKTTKYFNLESVEKKLPTRRILRKRGVTYANAIKFEKPKDAGSLMKSLIAEDSQMKKKEIEKELAEDKKKVDVSKAEEIEVAVVERKDFRELKIRGSRKTREDIVEGVYRGGKDDVSSDGHQEGEDIELAEFVEKMPGFTPKQTAGIVKNLKERLLSQSSSKGTSVIKRKRAVQDIAEYLLFSLRTYEDSLKDKYFEVSIRAGKDARDLPSMPKEIVFLVDCSLSIQPERLEQFKRGLSHCLNNLNKGDLFNVIAFKEKLIWFNTHSVKPDRSNIRNALHFVGKLTAGEGTDAYKALFQSIKVNESLLPSYIVLFSDGRPTHGLTNSRQIINDISLVNSGTRPIFAFSGGLRVNRYFLDFISYKNRGWTEYADRTHNIGDHISRMYDKIKDPILINLRYRVSGLESSEMFPKTLPDFYRGAEFTLYGRYTNEDKFSMQLLGDIGQITDEYILVGSLSDANKGDRSIARNWAFNKIYYLIGQLRDDRDNSYLIKEIRSLCESYNIITPYNYSEED